MNKKRHTTYIVIAAAVAIIGVLLLYAWQVFRLTSKQALSMGEYHLESISGALEHTISEARELVLRIGLKAFPLLEKPDELKTFIYTEKEAVLAGEHDCFNVYMAGTGWAIIPDFNMPDDYIATERDWYKGARRAQGVPYVTAPYVDAMTGNICYTVAVLLGDGDTVAALDYNMDNIQSHILQMYEGGSRLALIVTGEGIIAGCSDESMIGKKLNDVLPEYASIYSVAKTRRGFTTLRLRSGLGYENLFATASGLGWYLIYSESDWKFYQNSYLQLVGSVMIALLLLLVMVILIVVLSRREQLSRRLLQEKSRLIENICSQMTGPLTLMLDAPDRISEDPKGLQADELMQLRRAARRSLEALQEAEYAASREKEEEKTASSGREKSQTLRMNFRFRRGILLVLVLVIVISFVSNLWVSLRWGNEKLRSEVSVYDYMLTNWVGKQKSILDMFCSVISTNPDMLKDYDGMIAWLDRITRQYPEISVTYMTNPSLNPTVYMNNGWLPPEDWQVEERQWYVDTMASESGWTISTPYYDEQTGMYCVTFAERVYDADTGAYLGTFGIDFFLDKLISILGGSYTEGSYAFLTDTDGVIINHPYGKYQMTVDNAMNVSELSYGQLKADGRNAITIRDYDGVLRVLIARRNEETHFVIYEAVNFMDIYAALIISELVILSLLVGCAVMVYRLLTALMEWQDSMNARMQEAADTAIAAGKAKSRFLAQMSHEIRTPINAVLGMNEMILREAKDDAILSYASDIQMAGRTLLSLINSILDFSKIEEGKMEIIPVEYDTASLINNLAVSISERAKDKGLALLVDVDENLPARLFGDDVRLSQVIMNILTNAVKYTEKGEVRFTIAGGERRNGSIELRVSVEDTGIGIREEDIPRLFESFERLDEVRNHNIEGTGLGMSIVTRLLKMMDSELQVKSIYGKGSVFSFAVWQRIMSEKPIGNYTDRLEASRRYDGEGSMYAPSARILVVDDNAMNLKVAGNLMKIFGITPALASSGYEAIEEVRRNDYHIIFLDHMMPEMDGIETLSTMKREGLIKEGTTVIALTANAVNGAKEEYLAAGFDDYLSKPIEVDKLEAMLLLHLPEECRSEKPAAKEPSGQDGPDGRTAAGNQPPKEAGEVRPDGEEGTADPVEALRALGLDTDAGLRYAAGDRDFYLELIRSFAEAAPEGIAAIRKDYEEHALHDYQIRVHALKSTARQIGAGSLSELALAQEEAAKQGDLAAVRGGAESLLAAYDELRQGLEKAAGQTGGTEPTAEAESAVTVTAEEAAGILREAAAYLDSFEAERAAEVLQPLKHASASAVELREPIGRILRALDDFDTFGASELLSSLLEEMTK